MPKQNKQTFRFPVKLLRAPVDDNSVKPGDIRLLRDVNQKSSRRQPEFYYSSSLWRNLQVGCSVFLPGCTANRNDTDPRMRYVSTGSYSQSTNTVWTLRSTEERGVKGLRIWRTA